MAAASGDFWPTVGPYLLAGMVILIGLIYADRKEDMKWLKRNMLKLFKHLKLTPDE